ncbi:protein FAM133 isoform X2 [Parasteatoda tepidariorum]|uniref:protein FAM133 isoform X2 n=1 Tax=Parasteatoda tepidariorum TaxID=114398 RepID=UPI0039BC7D88
MGKRDTRYAFMNPIAMARARGPATSGGPSIRDYLNRDRPSWEEVKQIMQKKKEGSHTLAAWEAKMNEKFREELRINREKLLRTSTRSEKEKAKKRRKKRARSHKHKHKKSRKKRRHDKHDDGKKYDNGESCGARKVKKKHKKDK